MKYFIGFYVVGMSRNERHRKNCNNSNKTEQKTKTKTKIGGTTFSKTLFRMVGFGYGVNLSIMPEILVHSLSKASFFLEFGFFSVLQFIILGLGPSWNVLEVRYRVLCRLPSECSTTSYRSYETAYFLNPNRKRIPS